MQEWHTSRIFLSVIEQFLTANKYHVTHSKQSGAFTMFNLISMVVQTDMNISKTFNYSSTNNSSCSDGILPTWQSLDFNLLFEMIRLHTHLIKYLFQCNINFFSLVSTPYDICWGERSSYRYVLSANILFPNINTNNFPFKPLSTIRFSNCKMLDILVNRLCLTVGHVSFSTSIMCLWLKTLKG